jgi:hypothetical protein
VTNERLFDLVRFMRVELYNLEMISEEEYAWLSHEDKRARGSAERLTAYAGSRRRLRKRGRRIAELERSLKARNEKIVELAGTTVEPVGEFGEKLAAVLQGARE